MYPPRSTHPMTTYSLLIDAINDGINLERLLLATGIDQHTFYQYLDNRMFTSDQLEAIRLELKDWFSFY